MNIKPLILVILLALAAPVHAQEAATKDTAPLNLSTKDLETRAAAAEAKTKQLESVINAVIACNEQLQIYVPGAAGAPGSCMVPPLEKNVCDCYKIHEDKQSREG